MLFWTNCTTESWKRNKFSTFLFLHPMHINIFHKCSKKREKWINITYLNSICVFPFILFAFKDSIMYSNTYRKWIDVSKEFIYCKFSFFVVVVAVVVVIGVVLGKSINFVAIKCWFHFFYRSFCCCFSIMWQDGKMQ